MPGLTRGVGSRNLTGTKKNNNKKNNKKHFTMANLMKQIANTKKVGGKRKSRKAGRKSRSTRRR